MRGHRRSSASRRRGPQPVGELLELAERDGALPQEAREMAKLLACHLEGLDRSIDAAEKRIAAANRRSPTGQLLDRVPGVGPLIASVIAASVPDRERSIGRDFAAWLGLTPKQNSRAARRSSAITKQGNRYIRKMLVVGCTSTLRVAGERKGALADWIAALRARKPERLVAVALANKLARICWAIMTTGEAAPPGDVRQGVERKAIGKVFTFLGVWRAQRDVMNDMVVTEAEDNP